MSHLLRSELRSKFSYVRTYILAIKLLAKKPMFGTEHNVVMCRILLPKMERHIGLERISLNTTLCPITETLASTSDFELVVDQEDTI